MISNIEINSIYGTRFIMFNVPNLPSLKAIVIMEILSRTTNYLGINEISALSGFSKSTVHRVLNEMTQYGYVEKNEDYKKYRIGIQAVILASHFMSSNSLVVHSRDELKRLGNLTGETIHLIAVTDFEILYLDKLDTKHALGLMSSIGKRNPIYCTSGGKAILAFNNKAWLDDFFASVNMVRYTHNTITDKASLLNELEKIRNMGYAIDNCEHHDNIVCIGAPIYSREQTTPVAAISIAAPLYRFDEEMAHKVAPLVMTSAQNISKKLGVG